MEEKSYYEENSPFLQKTCDMMEYAYGALAQFPKSEKFAMAADIKKCMDKILELGVEANKKYSKKTTLRDLDIAVEKLKTYMRIAYRLKFLSSKRYDVWSGKVVELGKIVGGWMKALE